MQLPGGVPHTHTRKDHRADHHPERGLEQRVQRDSRLGSSSMSQWMQRRFQGQLGQAGSPHHWLSLQEAWCRPATAPQRLCVYAPSAHPATTLPSQHLLAYSASPCPHVKPPNGVVRSSIAEVWWGLAVMLNGSSLLSRWIAQAWKADWRLIRTSSGKELLHQDVCLLMWLKSS